MRYTILINQKQCLKHGLNGKQAALMDLIGQLNTWADSEFIDGDVYYNLAYSKIIIEMPVFFKVKDTAYRAILVLKKKGLIELKKKGRDNKNYVRLTPLGKLFFRVGNKSEPKQGSEIHPIRVGNSSDPQIKGLSSSIQPFITQGSEINPTYNNNITSYKNKEGVLDLNIKDYAAYIGGYFGKTSEEQLMRVFGFLNTTVKYKLVHFVKQFEYYKKYKNKTGEKVHRFETYQTEWNEQDWLKLLKNHESSEYKEPKPVYLNKVS